MTGKTLRSFGLVLVAFVVLVGLLSIALAGPPLICFPFEIGSAKSLPWDGGSGWNSPKADYNVSNLVQDTIALLSPDVPVIVRMETLRRAAIYGAKDPQTAYELLSRLMARALDAGTNGKCDALAWFDVGYLVETYKQAKWMYKRNLVEGLNGYAWAMKALRVGGADPDMELAAALMLDSRQQQKEHREHLRKAVAGATEGSLLAKNLITHFGHQGRTVAELRAKYGKAGQ